MRNPDLSGKVTTSTDPVTHIQHRWQCGVADPAQGPVPEVLAELTDKSHIADVTVTDANGNMTKLSLSAGATAEIIQVLADARDQLKATVTI